MPLCSNCHKNTATVHLTFVVNDVSEKTDLCMTCSQAMGFQTLDQKKLEALAVQGKKCEFCGREAFSGVIGKESAIYWCYDCGIEIAQIKMEFYTSEQSGTPRQGAKEHSFMSMCMDPEFQILAEAMHEKSVQKLKERRRQDGRDK